MTQRATRTCSKFKVEDTLILRSVPHLSERGQLCDSIGKLCLSPTSITPFLAPQIV
ncbi:MAG: hypothetical protein GH152_00055 [Dehalococcoidia bacterium]|nr:hypothetical protein [Dehalococcoidia bacterium]